jgi:hypothetical protein
MLELPPPDPSLEIQIASRGYSKGIAQTDGAQLLLRGALESGPFFIAGQWKNLSSPSANGEASAILGVKREAGGFELTASAAYKWQTGSGGAGDHDTFEFTGSASRAFGPVTPRIALTFSFDDIGPAGTSLHAEAGAHAQLGPGTSLSANVGRRERGTGSDYTSFNLGIGQRIGDSVTADLRYYDTAQGAQGDLFQSRLVASLRVLF